MRVLAALAFAVALAAQPLPVIEPPPGEVFLVLQPHHDDHTTDYGMGGLRAWRSDRPCRR